MSQNWWSQRYDEGPEQQPGTTNGNVPPASYSDLAFEAVFDSLATLLRQTGHIHPKLVGFECRGGRAIDVQIELVKSPEKVDLLTQRLLRKWGMVARVCLTGAVAGNAAAGEVATTPQAIIEIHDASSIGVARCGIDFASRSLQRDPLVRTARLATM
jgi:hypothetical protein